MFKKLLVFISLLLINIPISHAVSTATCFNSDCSLMLHANGEEGVFNKTITASGNAQVDTAQYKFGSGSVLFDGTGDYLSIPDSDDWYLGNGVDSTSWTIDFWIRFNGDPSGNIYGYVSQYVDTNNYWTLYTYSDNIVLWVRSGGSNIIYNEGSTFNPASGTWYHMALVKDGTNGYKVFVDGTQLNSFTDTDALPNFATPLRVGVHTDNFGTSYYLNGWIDEFRVTKGEAIWISGFTAPTSAYSVTNNGISNNTKLLIHAEAPDTSTAIYDSASIIDSSHSDTRGFLASGDTKLNTRKFSSNYGYFDGSGDYLSIPDSNDWNLGSGDFTVDTWLKYDSVPTTQGILLMQFPDNNNTMNFYDSYGGTSNTRKYGFFAETGNVTVAWYEMTNAYTMTAGTWYHIAFVRNGSTFLIFINGVSQTLTTYTSIGTLGDYTGSIWIGANVTNGYYQQGVLEEFRVSKGTARWTSNFTPSTSEYTSDSNTQLLLHMNNSDNSTTFADSGNTGHTVSANGDAKQVQIAKFNSGSIRFDGTGDYISTLDSNDWDLGSSNFTIDFWIRFNSLPTTGNYTSPINQWATSNLSWIYNIYNNSGTYKSQFYYSTDGTNITGNSDDTITLTTNTWYHIAIIRNGADLKTFQNGTQIGSTHNISTNTLYNTTTEMRIGAAQGLPSQYHVDGWIDEMRIVKGTTIWTSNFTSPTDEYSVCLARRRVLSTVIND